MGVARDLLIDLECEGEGAVGLIRSTLAPHLGGTPVPEGFEAAVVDAHCKEMATMFADYKKTWMDIAMPFIAKLIPADIPVAPGCWATRRAERSASRSNATGSTGRATSPSSAGLLTTSILPLRDELAPRSGFYLGNQQPRRNR